MPDHRHRVLVLATDVVQYDSPRNSSLVQDSIWQRTPSFSDCNFCGSVKKFFSIPASESFLDCWVGAVDAAAQLKRKGKVHSASRIARVPEDEAK